MDIGIAALGYTLCTAFSRTMKLAGITPLFDKVGAHVSTDYRDPMNDISFSGEGDLPDGLVTGSNGGEGMAISGISGGVTMIKDVTEGDEHDKWNKWSVSAENWPSGS